MMGTFPELVYVKAHEGLSEVSVDMSYRKREQLLELFFYNTTDLSFEKSLRKENSQNEHNAITLFRHYLH